MSIFKVFRRTSPDRPSEEEAAPARSAAAPASEALPLDIAPNDPLLHHFQSSASAVDLDTLDLDSAALQSLRDAGMKLVVPLISQGELIGLLNLGPRLSEQDYSGEDRRLLENLATQVAPAVRVAQLVRQQEAEARNRERVEQQLRVAQVIQQNFLPKEPPDLPGWKLAAYYQPAWEVGGDFYDFLHLSDGRLGLVIGDVTDKGVPAALVMAATRSIIRAAAQRLESPGDVLARVNDLLCPDIPPKMFATCMFAVLDPRSGRLEYANAGHNLPYLRTRSGVHELRATGMPLGLMPGMTYEVQEVTLAEGDSVLFHSDGLVEAHSPEKEMYGFPRLMEAVARFEAETMIEDLLRDLRGFSGRQSQQEDDVTLMTLTRTTAAAPASPSPDGSELIAEFLLPSEPGNERIAIERVEAAIAGLGLSATRLERLKTAVGEATMNAMEHGNRYQAELPVAIHVALRGGDLSIAIVDQGGDRPIPDAVAPDLDAKLAGLQSPRGWGLFLIKNMVDDLLASSDGTHHTLELVMHLNGARNA